MVELKVILDSVKLDSKRFYAKIWFWPYLIVSSEVYLPKKKRFKVCGYSIKGRSQGWSIKRGVKWFVLLTEDSLLEIHQFKHASSPDTSISCLLSQSEVHLVWDRIILSYMWFVWTEPLEMRVIKLNCLTILFN